MMLRRGFFWVWIGAIAAYNAWLWGRDLAAGSRFRDDAAAPVRSSAAPRLSILVAAWNEAPRIEQHIRSILELRYQDFEYILCAGGTDDTYRLARRFDGPVAKILAQREGEGKQRALRRCLDHATGTLVFFTDADCVVDDASLRRLIEPLLAGEVAATGASRPLGSGGRLCWLGTLQHYRERYGLIHAGPTSDGLLGRNCAIRRDVLEQTGALDLRAPTGTDYRVARALLRAGHRIVLVPHSTVATEYVCGPLAYARQHGRWLRNLYVHGALTGDTRLVTHAMVASMTGAVLATGWIPSALSSRGTPARIRGRRGRRVGLAQRLTLCLWAGAVVHALLSRARQVGVGARASGERPSWVALTLVPVWLALDAWIWLTTPLGLVSRSTREAW